MLRPDFGWEIEIEVELPSRAFCEVEGHMDGLWKIRLRDRHLQGQRFYRRALFKGIIGFV